MITYCKDFNRLKRFSLDNIKEVAGKVGEAVLHIESSGIEHKLVLEHPKVPAMSSTTVKDLFCSLTLKSVDFFRVINNGPDALWTIEVWKNNSPLVGHTIHCKNIKGLPHNNE